MKQSEFGVLSSSGVLPASIYLSVRVMAAYPAMNGEGLTAEQREDLADGKIEANILPNHLNTQRERIIASVEKSVAKNNTNIIIKADRSVKHRDVARVIKSMSSVEGINIYLAVLETD